MRRHDSGIAFTGPVSGKPRHRRCGARGREATLLAHSGGAGAPPGDTTIPCEELADGGPQGLPKASRARPPKRGADASEPEAGRRGPSESAARRRQDAAMERRGARAFRKKARTPQGVSIEGCAWRRSLPSHGARGTRKAQRKPGETTAHPAPVKNTGDDACPVDNAIDESARVSYHSPHALPRP